MFTSRYKDVNQIMLLEIATQKIPTSQKTGLFWVYLDVRKLSSNPHPGQFSFYMEAMGTMHIDVCVECIRDAYHYL